MSGNTSTISAGIVVVHTGGGWRGRIVQDLVKIHIAAKNDPSFVPRLLITTIFGKITGTSFT